MSDERRPASSFGAPEASPAEEPGESGLPLGPPATNGALFVAPATPAKKAKLALLALARRIFPAPGDAELRASALEAARADGSLLPLLKKLARAPLILVDDLGIASVPGKLYREFLEMLDDRQGQGATLITSQFPVSQWHEVIADPTVADAILDRLVHNAYRIELSGESMRKKRGRKSDEGAA